MSEAIKYYSLNKSRIQINSLQRTTSSFKNTAVCTCVAHSRSAIRHTLHTMSIHLKAIIETISLHISFSRRPTIAICKRSLLTPSCVRRPSVFSSCHIRSFTTYSSLSLSYNSHAPDTFRSGIIPPTEISETKMMLVENKQIESQ